ncbi:MAG: hypothetical protein ACOZNI_04710 [Myxococcota bacterium]
MSLLVLLSACGNPCQQICDEVFAYAEECGKEPSRDDLQACRDGYAEVDAATADQCRNVNDRDFVREWWTCDDVGENWQNLGK